MDDDLIALFSFEEQGEEPAILSEKHYRLVYSDDVTNDDLAAYRARPFD